MLVKRLPEWADPSSASEQYKGSEIRKKIKDKINKSVDQAQLCSMVYSFYRKILAGLKCPYLSYYWVNLETLLVSSLGALFMVRSCYFASTVHRGSRREYHGGYSTPYAKFQLNPSGAKFRILCYVSLLNNCQSFMSGVCIVFSIHVHVLTVRGKV